MRHIIHILVLVISTTTLSIDATHESKLPPFSCGSRSYPFCDTGLPVRERARDLISRLTLDEHQPGRGHPPPQRPLLPVVVGGAAWGGRGRMGREWHLVQWGRQGRHQLPSGHTHRLLIRRPSLASDCKGWLGAFQSF